MADIGTVGQAGYLTKSSLSNIAGRNSRFLLVVDSDANDLIYVSMLLQRFDYHICTAKTGEEAIELSVVSVPALIIAEMALADMNGLELIKRLKQDQLTVNLPVIVKTSNHTPDKERRCLQAGAFACIRNPVHAEDLYRAVQAAIESTPRKSIRIPTHLPVSVNDVQLDTGEGEFVSVLSEKGMFIRTLKPYQPSSTINVQIRIKDRIIKLEAVVLYSHKFEEGPYKEPGMGLQYTSIASQDQSLIRQFIIEEINRGINAL
ncbi:MAG: response regulator [Nitrospirae bacterium]|nr:response regulator [Nitrospirota bacterium]